MRSVAAKILDKGWTLTVTFRKEESYCFVFSAAGKDLGFAKASGYDESVVDTAYDRAVEYSERTKILNKEKAEKNPLLFGEY